MFKKDDKVKVVKGIKAFEGLTGTVLDTNGNQVKVKLNLSNDSELQKNLINVFEAYQLELESLDLLKEDNACFDNDMDEDFVFVDADGNTYSNENTQKAVDDDIKGNKQICCICGKDYLGYGNNAEPYKKGRCCDKCNKQFVIPARLKDLKKYKSWVAANKTDESLNEGYKEELKSTINDLESALRAPKTSPKYSDLIANYTTVQNARKELKELKKRYSDLTDKKESLTLTEEELKAWCSDNDANYYTQDIKDDKVIIRGLNEDLAEYNFKTKELKVFDYSGTKTPETKEDEDDDNYIRDYIYDIDMIDEKTEIPSWEFASIIATAEDTTEDAVVTEAHDRGFKVFLITASEYEKLVVASEKITEEDIMNDFAAYLEGNPKVTEVI